MQRLEKNSFFGSKQKRFTASIKYVESFCEIKTSMNDVLKHKIQWEWFKLVLKKV